ncbi:hypothetical protein KBF38_23450 [bacterium]|nr:hypothetical protein [bacterium]
MNNRLFVLGLALALLTVPAVQCKVRRLPAHNVECGRKAELAMLLNVANCRPYFGRAEVGVDESVTGIRGGNGSKRPLGQYLVAPYCEFSSAYTKESAETVCQFAYALHRFVGLKNRDYDSYLLSFSKNRTGFNYLTVSDQRAFARSWWEQQRSFNGLNEAQKCRFLDEAIVDATNLYGHYAERIYATSNYVAWQKGALSALLKPKQYQSCD